MAATDVTFRNQKTLDIVFGVSSLLMLVSVGMMLVQDYNRQYKTEQIVFRGVESAMAQRMALETIPSEADFTAAQERVKAALEKRKDPETEKALQAAKAKLSSLSPYNGTKAELDSALSMLYIAQEHEKKSEADGYLKDVQRLGGRLELDKKKQDDIAAQIKSEQKKISEIEEELTKAQSEWKKVNDRFETQVKLAVNKQYGISDWIRALPIIDGFASPVKIQQITNNEIPIDYNFKHVTRFDRCQTCHLGIDRPAYTRENLAALRTVPEGLNAKIEKGREFLRKRKETLNSGSDTRKEAALIADPSQLSANKVDEKTLTDARISQYCVHPRLDLFVGANSKHPVERFGCTSCHAGQGSSTSFLYASHSPNSSAAKKRWNKEHDWEFVHDWEFPMMPQRFVESACLKCHYEVTDLITSENRVEAPKLIRGYNLIRENGCFGCHEIAGTRGGRRIGPDLRNEPNPPLETLSASERTKLENDPENPPGKLRKVGPSLYRVAEKISPEFTVKWLRSPRSFRPDTKMPHFYGLSNNHPDVLPEDQKKFPDAEIHAITHYLYKVSNGYVQSATERQKDSLADRRKDDAQLEALLSKGREKLTPAERQEMDDIKLRVKLRGEAMLADVGPGVKGDADKGRVLFVERGCLACHSHAGTHTASGKTGEATFSPEILGEANFGPNLSQISEKLASGGGAKWLVNWLQNPQAHSPRSRMPSTHLTGQEAADLAAWLLAQKATELGDDWAGLSVPAPDEKALKDLARVYLVRILGKADLEDFLAGKALPPDVVRDLPADEASLNGKVDAENLKFYLGKKGVGRLGCYACHDIPGFDSAKSIGVGLNDWGKKDPNRLAFEDIANFLHHNYEIVDKLVDEKGKPVQAKVDHGHKKMPYEKFFADMLGGHHRFREGYLHQKILDPRSYDFNRLRPWDDRSRMPQFRFARSRKKADETDAEYEARSWKDEAEAREAVMTFILGLVAEPIPLKHVNLPTGARLAEVKGRQVLDQFNCNGCHLVRSGAFDFNASMDAVKHLDRFQQLTTDNIKSLGMHTFYNHHYWTGKTPTSDRLTALAIRPALTNEEGESGPGNNTHVKLRLTEALRYVGEDKTLKDFPATGVMLLPLADFTTDPKSIQSQDDLLRIFAAKMPYGGYFADLLTPYLEKKDPGLYKTEPDGGSGQARASLPPSLIGQGERTQTAWLYDFLLNPIPVRRMSILRMPKFNLSGEDARALVDYFSAVEQLSNPGTSLTVPHETLPQKTPLDSSFWKSRNGEYVNRLQAKTKLPDGKEGSLLEQRRAMYKATWDKVIAEQKPALEAEVKQQTETIASKEKALKDAKKEDVAGLKAALEKDQQTLKATQAELARLSPEGLEKNWLEREAYSADAWRLIANRTMCLQCHQVGNRPAGNPQTQGPPLALAHERLRPGWLERWISTPAFHVPYTSVMPVNFPLTKQEYQQFLAGTSVEQIQAIRDALMNYPVISNLPVNRAWNPDQVPATDKK